MTIRYMPCRMRTGTVAELTNLCCRRAHVAVRVRILGSGMDQDQNVLLGREPAPHVHQWNRCNKQPGKPGAGENISLILISLSADFVSLIVKIYSPLAVPHC